MEGSEGGRSAIFGMAMSYRRTPPLIIHTGEGDRLGFWAGLPVYAYGLPHETVEDRRHNLIGFVQGVFQVGVMIDSVFGDVESTVRIYVFAPNAGSGRRPNLLAPPVSATGRLRQSLRQNLPLDCTGHFQSTLAMFSGRWWWRLRRRLSPPVTNAHGSY